MDKLENTEVEVQGLITRFLEGTITDRELGQLKEWLEESEDHFALFTELRRNWIHSGILNFYDSDEAWQQLCRRVDKRRPAFRVAVWGKIAGYAAAVLITLFTVVYFVRSYTLSERFLATVTETIEPGSKKAVLILGSNERLELGVNNDTLIGSLTIRNQENTLLYQHDNNSIPREEFNRLITPRGGEYSVILSDGTKVWLNAESELKYPVQFVGEKRVVYLEGEAYFSVTKQEGKPFIVCSGDAKISVLGTEFNIRNYKNEELATTLVKGSVIVADARNNQRRLTPGQQAVMTEGGIEVAEVETILYTAWKDGFFVYRDQSLEVIMKGLSRWYDFTYFYQNQELGNSILTAKLKKFDSVEQIFEILAETGKFAFVRHGKAVTIVAK